jgi:hypothetical protein
LSTIFSDVRQSESLQWMSPNGAKFRRTATGADDYNNAGIQRASLGEFGMPRGN